jgi:hypothetical protein
MATLNREHRAPRAPAAFVRYNPSAANRRQGISGENEVAGNTLPPCFQKIMSASAGFPFRGNRSGHSGIWIVGDRVACRGWPKDEDPLQARSDPAKVMVSV